MEFHHIDLDQIDIGEHFLKPQVDFDDFKNKVASFSCDNSKLQSDFLVLKQKIILTDSLISSYTSCKNKVDSLMKELDDFKTRHESLNEQYENLFQNHVCISNNLQLSEKNIKLLENDLDLTKTKLDASEALVEQLTALTKRIEAKAKDSDMPVTISKSKVNHSKNHDKKNIKISPKKNIGNEKTIQSLYQHVILFGEKAKFTNNLSSVQIEQLDNFKKEAIELNLTIDYLEEINDTLVTGPPSCCSADSGLYQDDSKFDIHLPDNPSLCSDYSKCDTDVYQNKISIVNNRVKSYLDQVTSPISIETKSIGTSPLKICKTLNFDEEVKYVDSCTYVTEELIKSEYMKNEDIPDEEISNILHKVKCTLLQEISPMSSDCDEPIVSPLKKKTKKKNFLRNVIKRKFAVKKQNFLSLIESLRSEMKISRVLFHKKIMKLENTITQIQKKNIANNSQGAKVVSYFESSTIDENVNNSKLDVGTNDNFKESIEIAKDINTNDNLNISGKNCDKLNINNCIAPMAIPNSKIEKHSIVPSYNLFSSNFNEDSMSCDNDQSLFIDEDQENPSISNKNHDLSFSEFSSDASDCILNSNVSEDKQIDSNSNHSLDIENKTNSSIGNDVLETSKTFNMKLNKDDVKSINNVENKIEDSGDEKLVQNPKILQNLKNIENTQHNTIINQFINSEGNGVDDTKMSKTKSSENQLSIDENITNKSINISDLNNRLQILDDNCQKLDIKVKSNKTLFSGKNISNKDKLSIKTVNSDANKEKCTVNSNKSSLDISINENILSESNINTSNSSEFQIDKSTDSDINLNNILNRSLKRKKSLILINSAKKCRNDNESSDKESVNIEKVHNKIDKINESFICNSNKKRISHFSSIKNDANISNLSSTISKGTISDTTYSSLNKTDTINKAKNVLAELNKKNSLVKKSKIFLNRVTRKQKSSENNVIELTNIPNNQSIEQSPRDSLVDKLADSAKILSNQTTSSVSKSKEIVKSIHEETNQNLPIQREIVSYEEIDCNGSFNIKNGDNILTPFIVTHLECHKSSTKKPDLYDKDCKKILDILENSLSSNITVTSLDELNKKLEPYKEKLIAHSIVLFISESRSCDTTPLLLPRMPVMSYHHQSALCFMQRLRRDPPARFDQDIFELVMQNIEFMLFQLNKTPKGDLAQQLSKFYSIICYATKQKERLKVFCIDALYCMSFKSISVVSSAMHVWPQIFPKIDSELAKDPLVIVMMHLITSICNKDKYKVEQLSTFILKNYGFRGGEYNDDEILVLFKNILKDLKNCSSKKSLFTALLLFAKRCGTAWCHKKIILDFLLPILDDANVSYETKLFAAEMIGPLTRPFPNNMTLQREIIREKLSMALKNEASHRIQEAIICSLVSMSNRNPHRITQDIIKWCPMVPISKETETTLRSFVTEKPKKFWQNNPKYLSNTLNV